MARPIILVQKQVTQMIDRPARHSRLMLGCACLAVALAAADLTAVSTLLPRIIFDLEIPLPDGLTDAAWIVSAYLIGSSVTLPLSGRLSDRFARGPVFLLCLALFALGSIGAALATNLPVLIAARAVQALGAGAMVPVTMALATDLLPPRQWTFAFGVIGAVDTAGWAIGPVYGAFFVQFWDWRALFWINVPLALVIAGATWRVLRGLGASAAPQPIDWRSATVLTAGLIAVNWGLSRLGESANAGVSVAEQRLPVAAAAPWLIAGAALLGVFTALERRSPAPLIGGRWVAQTSVIAAGVANLIFGVLLVIATVNVPLFVNATMPQGGLELEEFVQAAARLSGFLLGAMTLLMTACSLLGGWLAPRLGARAVLGAGAAASAVGFWLMRGWTIGTPAWSMALHLALVGVGLGLLIAPLATMVVNAAPATERGLASSLVLLARLSGMSIGLSALTAWSLTRFRALAAPYSIVELPTVIDRLTAQVLAGSFGVALALAGVVGIVVFVGGTTDHG